MLGSSPPSQGNTANSLPIAILGAGNVGAALARVWASCGHSIAFGVQDPVSEKVTAAIAALKGKGRAAHNEEAVQSATVAEGFQYNRGREFRERTVRGSGVVTASSAEMIRRPRQWPANTSNLRGSQQ